MVKEYYEIKTYMHFEKTVLVPVDEVKDVNEAKELVSNAVESCEIDLLGDDAYCGEKYLGQNKFSDRFLQNSKTQIIHKKVEEKRMDNYLLSLGGYGRKT